MHYSGDKLYGREITDLQMANILNEVKRHCKIGKVVRKYVKPALPDIMRPQPVIPSYPFNNGGFQPWWMRGPWCNTAGTA